MSKIDWLLVVIPLLVVFAISAYTTRYLKSVSDFLSGGRVAGRYLLAVAKGEFHAGAVGFVASFEVTTHSGFTLGWWGWISVPVSLVVAISGFIVYRFRQTRAMTLAQFFEVRYSKGIRVFTGILGFLSGIINFGIIPAVGSRFMVYYLGLPETVTLLGATLPTYVPVMAVLLTITTCIALSGGLITVMVSDCVEGIFSQLIYLVLIAALLWMFSWHQIHEVLANRPPGQSLMNPFDSSANKDFNIWYVLMFVFVNVYGTMAWQSAGGYNSAARTAHESRMSGLLGRWREQGKGVTMTLLGICALTFLSHADFAGQAAQVKEIINHVHDPQVRAQMTIPITLAHILPIGVKGLFCAILLMGIFGGDSTHLHSWSGIFVQDLLVPLRKTPFGPKAHIRALRWTMVGVAVFAFLFGSLYRQTEYIVMWWAVTFAIYVGGAGAAIIGGLYWKKGTTAGAWVAIVTGSLLSLGGIVARQIYGDQFPLNGQEISFYATLIAITTYVIVSLLTCKEDYNIDRMLHRGEYAAIAPLLGETIEPAPHRKVKWGKLIGFDEDFTLGDKWTTGSLFAWSMWWFTVLIVGTIWNWIAPWPIEWWSAYWQVVGIGLPILLAVVTGVWFTWGGVLDIRDLFQALSREKVNELDDGTVVDHQNLDERIVLADEAAGEHLSTTSAPPQNRVR